MNPQNKFSLRRACAVWRFYWPGAVSHSLIIAAVAVVCYCLGLAGTFVGSKGAFGFYAVASYILAFAIYLGPLHFARFRDKAFADQLPATAGERTAVMCVYSILYIPLVASLAWLLATGVAAIFTDNYSVTDIYFNLSMQELNTIGIENYRSGYMFLQQLQTLIPIMVCLYTVVASRRSAATHGVVAVIGSLIAISIIGAVFGVIAAFQAGVSNAVNGSDFDHQGFAAEFGARMIYIVYWISGIAVAVTIAAIAMIRRKIALRRI